MIDYKTPEDRLRRAMKHQRRFEIATIAILFTGIILVLLEVSGLTDNLISWLSS